MSSCRATNANPSRSAFANYGGRGITVCARWAASFEAFLEDMGQRPAGTSIDRIDNDRGYEPGNCRWTTREVQGNNRRGQVLLTHEGETMSVARWARRIGVSPYTLYSRAERGLPAALVLHVGIVRERAA